MTEPLIAALRPLLDRAAAWMLAQPEDVRRDIAAAARAVAELADPTRLPPAAVVPPPLAPPPVVVTPPEPLRPGALDDLVRNIPILAKPSTVPVYAPPPEPRGSDFVPLPLATVTARCKVKAAAAKLVGKRAGGGGDTAAEEAALRQQAEGMPDCGLWMFDPNGYPKSKAVWDDLAGGFLVCAQAADLLRGWTASGPDMAAGQETLTLAAEAQSMLLYAVADVGWVNRDHEQVQMFVHIRELGKQHQIYVPRYLRREDPADPAHWPDLAVRLRAAVDRYPGVTGGTVVAAADPVKVRQKTLSNLKYKLKKVAEDPAAHADEWPRVVELLDQAVAAGVPPSSLDIREVLLPIYDRLPDDLPTTPLVERVFRATELYLDARQAAAEAPVLEEPPAPQVARVADWLRGKEIVLIGGQRRPHHVAAITRAFGLADVRWLSTPEHTSYTVFESDIARPEVAVVLLAIRWSSHDYAEVQRYCDKYGKPLVRLTAGYNANQIAHQVGEQAGERLAAASGDHFSAGL